MPRVDLILYKEEDTSVPLLDWLRSLPSKPRDKCIIKIERLRDHGHELHRPEADYLRDGVYELRIRFRTMNYRILYFFQGSAAVVLSHGITKEDVVPAYEIDKALMRKGQYEEKTQTHTFIWRGL